MVYLTADKPVDDAALTTFEIEAVLPYRVENVKTLLQARGIGQLEIKKRGVDCDLERLRSQLRVKGDQRGTLIVTRVGDQVQAILAKRIAHG
jgi:THUMP domain-like